MILDRLFAPPPEARLLPAEKLHGPTVAVMAIMTFAMIVVAAGGLALANAAALVSSSADNRYVIQLPAADTGRLTGVLSAARSAPGVLSATAVPESEMRETLERWLGSAAASDDLPVPALVTVELAGGADPAAVARAVRAQVPEAVVSAETAELAPALDSLRALHWLALTLVVLMAGAAAAAVILAARGALDTHRSTVEIMHGIGATDAQVTRLFERKIAVDAAAGALGGLVAAALLLLLVGGGIAAAAGDLAAAAPLDGLDLLVLAAIPIATVALAVAVAHWTLHRALRATL